MQSWGDSGTFWVLLFIALAALYFLPTIIGLIRKVDGLGLVFLLNALGWIGWPAALILAFGPRRLPPPTPMPIYPPPVVLQVVVYPDRIPVSELSGWGTAP